MSNSKLTKEQMMIWIECYCWFYPLLSEKQQREFITLLDKFLQEANFVGVGIDITDEMKIAVGGWAVLLVLNRPLSINWYKRIERISIYPGTSLHYNDALGSLVDGFHYCQIHLAWEDVRDSATKATDSGNTILHEFAHALDHLDREFDGNPSLLLIGEEAEKWKSVFCREFILDRPSRERDKLWEFFGLGAWNKFDPEDPKCVNVGELFAVSTEMFFECPLELQENAPEVYDCLKMLYHFDPIVEFPKKRNLRKTWDAVIKAINRPKWV